MFGSGLPGQSYPVLVHGLDGRAPPVFDRTDGLMQEAVYVEADALLDAASRERDVVRFLEGFRDYLADDIGKYRFFTHLVVCNALSKAMLSRVQDTVHVSVCVSVDDVCDQVRTSDALRATEWVGASDDGEDLLRQKVAQLDWVTSGSNGKVTWSMVVCDDGCQTAWSMPNGTQGVGSGKMIETIAREELSDKRISVVYLADGIRDHHPVCAGMSDVSESSKGGALQYAMQMALDQ